MFLRIASVWLLVLTPPAFAKTKTASRAKTPAQEAGALVRHVKKDAAITVNQFDEKLGAFLLTINSEPAVGPNYVTPEELRRAIEFDSDSESMVKNKSQIIGSIYQVKSPMRLLTENEVTARRAKAK